jgi:hypothetical protein
MSTETASEQEVVEPKLGFTTTTKEMVDHIMQQLNQMPPEVSYLVKLLLSKKNFDENRGW